MISQRNWVIRQLNEYGRVSRNDALKMHITRLGAIIHQLNQEEGWNIEGEWKRSRLYKDYVYYPRERKPLSTYDANLFLKSLGG